MHSFIRHLSVNVRQQHYSILAVHGSHKFGASMMKSYSKLRPISKLFSTSDALPTAAVGTEASQSVSYYHLSDVDQPNISFGDFSTMASQSQPNRKFAPVEYLGTNESQSPKEGDIVWIRGRVASVRAKGNACFMVLRSKTFNTVQACHFKDKENPDISKQLIKYVGALPLESIVDVMGIVSAADVKSCSQSNVEIKIVKVCFKD